MKASRFFSLVLTIMLGFQAPIWGDDEATDASGFGKVRIESEHKLSVPNEIKPQVWEFLKSNYSSENLQKLDPGFTAEVSIEYFVDVYYDDEDFFMLANESAIRHRTRLIPDNPSHPKHGRSLIQLKLKRAGDKDYNRSEIKFSTIDKSEMMKLPAPMGLVKKNQRDEFKRQVSEIGLNPYGLKDKITLNQRRSRVYISRDGSPFATITFDEVSSKKWWASCEFTEIEMELNEINYTEGDAGKRELMENINQRLKLDVLKEFPQIKQDQTPKYNKMFNCFDQSLPMFRIIVNHS
jgi:adenylate cyclase class IV